MNTIIIGQIWAEVNDGCVDINVEQAIHPCDLIHAIARIDEEEAER